MVISNTISDNSSNSLSGGLTLFSCPCGSMSVTVTGNRKTGNSALIAGGGVLATSASRLLAGNIIAGNHAGLAPGKFGSGGVAIADASLFTMTNNLIADNTVGATPMPVRWLFRAGRPLCSTTRSPAVQGVFQVRESWSPAAWCHRLPAR